MERYLITDALAAWLSTQTGKQVKPMQGPETVLNETFDDTLPYALLEPMGNAEFRDSWGGAWDEADLPYQVISYGKTGLQAEALAGLVHKKYLDPSIAMNLPDVSVMRRKPDGGADRPENVGVNLWEVRESFILQVHAS